MPGQSEYVSLYRPEMARFVTRANHTAVFLEPAIYMFGGTDGVEVFNSISAFDLDTRLWSDLPLRDPCPCPRIKHAACLVRWQHVDYIYVFGGVDGTRCLDDFWRCNLATGAFELIVPAGSRAPPALSSHCMARLGASEIVVFGGVSNKQLVTQTWFYNLETNTWSTSPYNVDQPEPCMGATIVSMPGGHCLLFGGISTNGFLSHCWKLTSTHRWELLPVQKNGPMPRAFHCALPIGEDRLLIHGGEYGKQSDQKLSDTWILYASSRIWKRLQDSLFTPQPRSNHAAVIWRSKSGNYRLFIIGGRGREGLVNEFWCFNLTKAGLGQEDYMSALSLTQLDTGGRSLMLASSVYDTNVAASSVAREVHGSMGLALQPRSATVSFNMPDRDDEPLDLGLTQHSTRRASSRSYAQSELEASKRSELVLLQQKVKEALDQAELLAESHNTMSEVMAAKFAGLDQAIATLRNAVNAGRGAGQELGPPDDSALQAVRAHLEAEIAQLKVELMGAVANAPSGAPQRQQTVHPDLLKADILADCRKLVQGEALKVQTEIVANTRVQCLNIQNAAKAEYGTAMDGLGKLSQAFQQLEASCVERCVPRAEIQTHEPRISALEAVTTKFGGELGDQRQSLMEIERALAELSEMIVGFCRTDSGKGSSLSEAVRHLLRPDFDELRAKVSRLEKVTTSVTTGMQEIEEHLSAHPGGTTVEGEKASISTPPEALLRDEASVLFIQNAAAPFVTDLISGLRKDTLATIEGLRVELGDAMRGLSKEKELSPPFDAAALQEQLVTMQTRLKNIQERVDSLEVNRPGANVSMSELVESITPDLLSQCCAYVDDIRQKLEVASTTRERGVNQTMSEHADRLIACEARLAEYQVSLDMMTNILCNDDPASNRSSRSSTPVGREDKVDAQGYRKLRSQVSKLVKETSAMQITLIGLTDAQQKLSDEMLRVVSVRDVLPSSSEGLTAEDKDHLLDYIEALRNELRQKDLAFSELQERVAQLENRPYVSTDDVMNIAAEMVAASQTTKASVVNFGSPAPVSVVQAPSAELRPATSTSIGPLNESIPPCPEFLSLIPVAPHFNASAWSDLRYIQRTIFDNATQLGAYFNSVSVDPSFNLIAASDGGFLRVWNCAALSREDFRKAMDIHSSLREVDINTAEDVIECPGVTCCAVGGNFLCAGNDRGYLAAWPSVGDPYQVVAFLNDSVSALTVLVNGTKRRVVGGSENGYVLIWDPLDEQIVRLGNHTAAVTCADAHGQYCLTGSRDCSAIVWDVYAGQEYTHCVGHSAPVLCCHVCQGTTPIAATGSEDGTVRLWDLRDCTTTGGKARYLFKTASDVVDGIVGVHLNRDLLISTSRSGTIKLWDLRMPSPECIQTLGIDSKNILASGVLNNSFVLSADMGSLIVLEFQGKENV